MPPDSLISHKKVNEFNELFALMALLEQSLTDLFHVVTKVATCENLLELFHKLLSPHMNIKKMTFRSGDNCASVEY